MHAILYILCVRLLPPQWSSHTSLLAAWCPRCRDTMIYHSSWDILIASDSLLFHMYVYIIHTPILYIPCEGSCLQVFTSASLITFSWDAPWSHTNSFQALSTCCSITFPQQATVTVTTVRWLPDPPHLNKKHHPEKLSFSW